MGKAAETDQRWAAIDARLAEIERAVGIRREEAPAPVPVDAGGEPAGGGSAPAGEG